MRHLDQLKDLGLFDAKVPRYTSYPPANHFLPTAGQVHQRRWIEALPEGSGISLYIHIPFCRRLCWFCACRTQGTQTNRPVDAYVDLLLCELERVSACLPEGVKMSRLHLGGGTPTILHPDTMDRLLGAVFARLPKAPGFEFSVEIDPTEAAPDLLAVLAAHGMDRASIGVQDFAPNVQEAIGRLQSAEETRDVVTWLRGHGVRSINLDLLYGLPFQTSLSLEDTLKEVIAISPDRIALYGYAHVPWVSKRQVMIDETALPGTQSRFRLAERAREILVADGYLPIGIDHFARPGDGLAAAANTGRLRRNFQGYTDDPADAILGLGASAISAFPQGYAQNAAATSAYAERIAAGGLAAARGYPFSPRDIAIGRMIEMLMCNFEIDGNEIARTCPLPAPQVEAALRALNDRFPDISLLRDGIFRIAPHAQPLARIIAHGLDEFDASNQAHSVAI